MMSSEIPGNTLQSFKPTPPIFEKFDTNSIVSPIETEFSNGCKIQKIGSFHRLESNKIINYALNIRKKEDIGEETFCIMDGIVGDGALIVSTMHHSTILVPPFSELSIFVWDDGPQIRVFDDFNVFRNFIHGNYIDVSIDEHRITQFLASARIHNSRTSFVGLTEVLHGHSITALNDDNRDVLTEINHLPDLFSRQIDSPFTFRDAAETVKKLTHEAIIAKSGRFGVGLTTSGGFDSSLIGLVYSKEFSSSIPNIYHIYSSSVPGLNEIEYLNDVRERMNHQITWLDAENARDEKLDFPHMRPDFRPPLIAGLHERNWMLYSAAKSDGVSILLSGEGGDQLMLCVDEISLAREFRQEGSPLLRAAISEALINQNRIWPVLGSWLTCNRDKDLRRWLQFDHDNTVPSAKYLKQGNALPIDCIEEFSRYEQMSISRLFQICTLNDSKHNMVASSFGICERRPFLYWPLVKFCISCPRSILMGKGRERDLFRRAFADVLPRSIVNRTSKSGDVDVPRLFDYESVKRKIIASEILSDYLDMDSIVGIDVQNLNDEQSEFLMRCATVESYLRVVLQRP